MSGRRVLVHGGIALLVLVAIWAWRRAHRFARFDRFGAVRGSVTQRGRLPTQMLHLVLKYEDDPDWEDPLRRHEYFRGDGTFELEDLPIGLWSFTVTPAWASPSHLLARGQFDVLDSVVSELSIDALDEQGQGLATVRGHVVVDGDPEGWLGVETDQTIGHFEPVRDGRFELTGLTPGVLDLRITDHLDAIQRWEQIPLRAGEVRDLEVRLDLCDVAVSIVDPAGNDAEEADLCVRRLSVSKHDPEFSFARVRNLRRGRCTLRLPRGRFRLEAEADLGERPGVLATMLVVQEDDHDLELELALQPAIDFEGAIEFAGTRTDPLACDELIMTIKVLPLDTDGTAIIVDPGSPLSWIGVDRAPRRFVGFRFVPGPYRASFEHDGVRFESEPFEVDASGGPARLRLHRRDD